VADEAGLEVRDAGESGYAVTAKQLQVWAWGWCFDKFCVRCKWAGGGVASVGPKLVFEVRCARAAWKECALRRGASPL
jgi:hypothetical protein